MLRAMQASTARRHSHLCPPVSALHPQESAGVKPKSFHPARCCPSCVLSSGEQPKTQPKTHPKTPFGKRKAPEEWESASKTQHGPKRAALCPSTASRANSSDENSVYANPLDHVRANRAKLTSLGLQPLDGSLSAWNRPGWLTDALPWLRMRARIVDFWAYEPTNHIWEELHDYLVYLGFEVAADVTSTQRPSACGYIAARSIVTMHAAHSQQPHARANHPRAAPPAGSAPARSAPARSAPARSAPARSAPARSAPAGSAPARSAPPALRR